MSMSLSVKDNADQLLVALEAKGRRMADVLKFAINDTVDDMVKGQRIEMRRVFDNPRPYTLNALFPKYVGKRGGILQAGIAFRETGVKGTPAYKYLMPNIKGTQRRMKRSEKGLQALGLLQANYQTVMGDNFERDQYGDISGGQYTRMLAELGASGDGLQGAKSQRNPRTKGDRKFIPMRRKDGRLFAIAERRGDQLVMMLVVTGMRTYKPRYDFYGLASRQVQYSLPKHFNRIFNRMMGGGGAVTPVPMSQAA